MKRVFNQQSLIRTLIAKNRTFRAFSSTSAALTESSLILLPFQHSLLTFHDVLGGKWWSTIAVSTVLLRSSLIPLTLLSRHTIKKLFSGHALGKTIFLNHMYQLESQQATKLLEKESETRKVKLSEHFSVAAKLQAKRVRLQFKAWKDLQIRPFIAVIPSITQFSLFILYAISVRDLIRQKKLDLTNEGLFWFTDLSLADETYILPLLAVSSTYILLDKTLRRQVKGKPLTEEELKKLGLKKIKTSFEREKIDWLTMKRVTERDGKLTTPNKQDQGEENEAQKDIPRKSAMNSIGNGFQYLMLFVFPMTAELPSAIFMYWLPSVAFGYSQFRVFSYLAEQDQQESAKQDKTDVTQIDHKRKPKL